MSNKPLSLDLVEQGRCQQRLAREMRRAFCQLGRYYGRFGEAAVGGTYTIAFKLRLVVRSNGRIEIGTGKVMHTEPGEPGEVTFAQASMYGEGEWDLFVPVSGSVRDPEQAKLFTDDGRLLG